MVNIESILVSGFGNLLGIKKSHLPYLVRIRLGLFFEWVAALVLTRPVRCVAFGVFFLVRFFYSLGDSHGWLLTNT